MRCLEGDAPQYAFPRNTFDANRPCSRVSWLPCWMRPKETQGSSWGYLKVNSSETLSIFGNKYPQNGSKDDTMAPRTTLGYPRALSLVFRVSGTSHLTCPRNWTLGAHPAGSGCKVLQRSRFETPRTQPVRLPGAKTCSMQGYLAHKNPPPPLWPP